MEIASKGNASAVVGNALVHTVKQLVAKKNWRGLTVRIR
jgi:hypothetical protein